MDNAGEGAKDPAARSGEEADALIAERRWKDALAPARREAKAAPADAAAALRLGILLSKCGHLEEGEAELRRGLALSPGSAPLELSLSHTLLAQGRYKEGWPLLRAKERIPALSTRVPRGLPFPRWNGESLKGKRLAIFPDEGLGDQIQYVRFLPSLVASAEGVTLFTSRSLARLLRPNFPDADIVVAEGPVEFADPDYWTLLQDIPGILGVEINTIPTSPYLVAQDIGPRLGEGFKIGLKTQGNPNHVNDRQRSLPNDHAAHLRARLPGTVISLEPEESGAVDMADTAAIIAQLDLIVSVDTSVAHLAGAMGKPCLLLLPGFGPDWRWMTGRSDSPWYPGHRLVRASQDNDWHAALDEVVAVARHVQTSATMEALLRQARDLLAGDRVAEAQTILEQAVRTDASHVPASFAHAMLLLQTGQATEAEQAFRKLLKLAPDHADGSYMLATALLMQGRFREAWPFYEARTRRQSVQVHLPRKFPFPQWKGESIDGKHIVIFPEPGFGEQIQFARFVSRLVRRGADVTLLAAPELQRLFEANLPGIRVLPASGNVEFPDPDYWTTLADLPGLLLVTADQLWDGIYIRAEGSPVDRSHQLRVGLATRGSATCRVDRHRSLPPEMAARLRAGVASAATVVDLVPSDSKARDFADTAQIMATLDIVVTVDTAVAHLAGAMGKQCLLLLGDCAVDWRWMQGRDDSPWYPEHMLFRASLETGWQAVVDQVVTTVQVYANPRVRKAMQASRQALIARDERRYPDAIALWRQAIEASPKNPNPSHNLARLLYELGRAEEAEKLERRALAIEPDGAIYAYSLGLFLLAQGRYAEGWPLYEARTRVENLRSGFPTGISFPRWQGEDISGKRVALFPEQGLGDQLMFARFVPQLRDRGVDVVLFAPPALCRLFALAFPDATVVPSVGTASFPRSQVWTTLVELPRLLDARLENLPPAQYLTLERQGARDGRLRIGIMMAGNASYRNDAHRSLPREMADRLRAELPGEIIDLDPSSTGARDLLETAQIMTGLDLVVSVDTSVGHLAGVVGVPCHLLLGGFATDWRWLRDRVDSPWYPHHRLYRGTSSGDWQPAIDALLAEVGRLAEEARIALPAGAA